MQIRFLQVCRYIHPQRIAKQASTSDHPSPKLIHQVREKVCRSEFVLELALHLHPLFQISIYNGLSASISGDQTCDKDLGIWVLDLPHSLYTFHLTRSEVHQASFQRPSLAL
jgi:hypothetical protein